MKVLAAAMSLLLLAYAAARAAQVPLTYDEAASYIRYIDTSVPATPEVNVFSLFSFEVATNHFVNTVLTKAAWAIGGGGEVWLRLPSLAAYAAFMVFAFLILEPRVDPWIGLAGFALLALNPYAVEFFALSRGYGLSLAFLMGALLFLMRFLEDGRPASASRALACALAGVMANFALLNAYAGLCVVILVAGAAMRYGREAPPRMVPAFLLPLTAAVFAALVLSQDVNLSATLYKPVTVSLLGVAEQDLARVHVVEVDIRGRDRRSSRDAGTATWHSNPGAHLRGLRVEIPADAAANLAGLEVLIGRRVFKSGAPLDEWIAQDLGGMRVLTAGPSLSLPHSRLPLFRSLLNWSGDAYYARCLATATACVLLALTALAAVLKIAGRLFVRAGLVGGGLWRALESSALWTAAFAGVPVFLLKTRGELYFGGIAGLVTDSYLSEITRSFHGLEYTREQTPIVFALILMVVLAFTAVCVVSWRQGAPRRVLAGLCVIGVIAIASLLEIVQHALFDTLYLTDRTALFYIPLCTLFVILAGQAMAESWRAGRIVARTVMVTAAALAALHFVAAANTTSVIEWRTDESTKAMMADLRDATRQRPAGSRILLGVEPFYSPVAVYYARKMSGAEVVVVPPSTPGVEFFYGRERQSSDHVNVIHAYPATGTALTAAFPP